MKEEGPDAPPSAKKKPNGDARRPDPHRLRTFQQKGKQELETMSSVWPIAEILLGAAHADDELCEHEAETVRGLLCQLLDTDTLPEALEQRLEAFDPGRFDLETAAHRFAGKSRSDKRRLVELVREVVDANGAVDIDEDRYLVALVLALSLNRDEVDDLIVHAAGGVNGRAKRLFDVLFAGAFLATAWPLLAAIGAGVKLTSPGPVLFKQRRYGAGGEEIEVWKFRSMRVMEDGAEVKQATKGDARITPLGAFLRRTSLDELPQFVNVLRGEMSVVGPRPHAIAHNELYRTQILEYMLRHKAKPGITGWAQVNGWRGETDTLEKMIRRVEHDIDYIRNWSLALDLKIVWLTIFGRKVRQNAY
ncbi:MAG TPA: exopolysaccharide biosynthesis polyprenyl glycosylphosphotransferase [Polyangiaceae bacterium LLY-WYZ-15_(1-7)]|nr:exopolysaccharide biosynthesis polyprenyl glycosylphosphotransferase [Polyangiaceae bacterium LLY-WYZ-15_(1-7)]HJL00707.1 exopolysaccharide biosynthesis polyprenyl glycosylphosphotransferase [Polyangiaceae bacterium LLY-WYZ-15_(1-7)]HJL07774.1 exopolysaccharide biosynthesis polyprenyl glycosylphosphotransferase [Polyangiaceae bacterium LLY-WYZ-15_(1-7)]HJL24882.1 exopolysaccharide biosynthesis polyprenyl glycosylphosphotransferase [Polyangiaceae bacterium LLY-WYZ-15_(1-7)]HJL29078.1 exopolys